MKVACHVKPRTHTLTHNLNGPLIDLEVHILWGD